MAIGPAIQRKIDAHCHYWRLARGDYGWLRPDVPELAPIHRDFGPDDLRPLAAAAGVTGRILVQAAPTEAETRFMLDLAQEDEGVAGIVGWVDLAHAAGAEAIARFAPSPLFKGVRPMLQDIADPDWIAERPHPEAIAALGRHGLRFDALVKAEQLSALTRFVEANPDLPVVIDHAAKPALGATPDDPSRLRWDEGMADLSRAPTVFCKLSGLLTEMPARLRRTPRDAAAALEPLVEKLLGWFGPHRLMWGSDWPVLTLAAGYDFWVETTDLLLAGLGASERADILAGTAARFYGLDGGAG